MKRAQFRPFASWFTLFASVAGLGLVLVARTPAVGADKPAAAAAAPAAVPTNCKVYRAGACCDPATAAHLTKEAVFSSCGQSEATYLGEARGDRGQKETCRYVFKIGTEEPVVELYVPEQKEVPPEPQDMFFTWKRIGKVFMTDKAASPKSAPMLARATGLWLPGKGFFVSVNVSTKVCSKADAAKLARKLK